MPPVPMARTTVYWPASVVPTIVSGASAIGPILSRDDDELAAQKLGEVPVGFQIGALEGVEHGVQRAVIQDELEEIELLRRQLAQLARERRGHGELRAGRRQVVGHLPDLVELAHALHE